MSIPPTPYESFSTSNQSIVPSGAWSFELDHINDCFVNSDSIVYQIDCGLSSPFNQTVYYPTLEANISINLANYGGATSLNFAWTYWPVYSGTNVTAGTSIPVRSKVGDVGFDDSFPTIAFDNSDIYPWTNTNSSKISHSGSTSVVRGSDPTIGYIALQINFTVSTGTVPNLTTPNTQIIYCWVKDIGINITTPLQSSTPTASSTSPSSPATTIPIGGVVGATVGAVIFITLIIIALLFFRRRRERGKGHIADETTFNEPVNHEDPLRKEGEGPTHPPWVGPDSAQPTPISMVEPNDRPTTPWTEGIVSSTSSGTVLNKSGLSTGHFAGTKSEIGTSGQHSSSDSNGLPPEKPPNTGRPVSIHSSSFSAMPDYPPPIYGPEGSVRHDMTMPPSFSPQLAQSASTSRAPPPSSLPEPVQVASTSGTLPPVLSPELAEFASANRDVINQSLETRLQAAGYLPTDDPNDLTPEQWRNEHGVTRLELNRLKNLYTRNR